MATFAGVWLVLYPPAVVWFGVLLAVGWRLGDSGLWLLVSLLTLPLLARLLGGPPPGPERRNVFLRRAFLDRDVASHAERIRREPDGTPGQRWV